MFKCIKIILLSLIVKISIYADNKTEPFEVIDKSSFSIAKRLSPLVIQDENSKYLAPHNQEKLSDLIQLVDFSYHLGQKEAVQDKNNYKSIQNIPGWEMIGVISATRGYFFADPNSAFLAYNKEDNRLAVVYHGSQNLADWVTNFMVYATDLLKYGLKSKGGVHTGFAEKFYSGSKQLEEILTKFLDSLTDEQRSNVIIDVAGHSQGGALAGLATLKICEILQKRYNIKNTENNQVHGIFLSTPRVFKEDCAQYYENTVGKNNSFRLNVKHDIVPNAVLGKTAHGILSLFSENFADTFSGYKSIGHLALQNTLDTIKEGYEISIKQGRDQILNGNISASLSVFMALFTLPMTPVVYSHLGTQDMSSRDFNPKMVSKDIINLLANGERHQMEKISQTQQKNNGFLSLIFKYFGF
jgi:hypothetical protein